MDNAEVYVELHTRENGFVKETKSSSELEAVEALRKLVVKCPGMLIITYLPHILFKPTIYSTSENFQHFHYHCEVN